MCQVLPNLTLETNSQRYAIGAAEGNSFAVFIVRLELWKNILSCLVRKVNSNELRLWELIRGGKFWKMPLIKGGFKVWDLN